MFENELLSVETCHWIVPVFPVNVILSGCVPEQIACDEEAVPPTLAAFTVILPVAEIVLQLVANVIV
ncbi:hypothetical protein AB9T88_05460 [Flavobacterium sp. LBUM151]